MSEFLTPSGLAVRLVERTGIKLETAKNFSTIFFTIVRKGLKDSESFSVYNFGTFKKTWIEATVGLNPSTGEKINIPAHWRIKFVPCAAVAKRINRPYAHLKAKELPEDEPEVVEEEPVSVMPDPIVQEEEEDDPAEEEFKKSIGYDPNKGLLKRAIELSEKEDDDEDEIQEKKPVKLFVILGLGILFLVLLLSLLLKACSGVSKKPAKRPEAKKTEQPVENIPVQEEKPEVSEELEVEKQEEIEAALLFESYSVPTGSDYHTIAEEKYGNRHLWPVLYAANKSVKPDPDLIGAYNKIKIPSLLTGEEGKRQIEDSVMAAYNGYLLTDISLTSEIFIIAHRLLPS